MFTYGSICSGIEAASVAWKGLGKPLWFSEIEPFPCAVLAHHFPDIPNLGDMTALPEKILNREVPAPDVLVGGTPCQAFSVAGKRESLNDDRGNLTLALIHILEAIDYVRNQDGQPPCILVWENVPGVLSTSDNAFGYFLAGLVQESQPLQPTGKRWTNSGYVHSRRTVAWRTFDAQYFGLAQRRKRVFVVASARRRSIAEILIEQKSVSGDIEPSKITQQNATIDFRKGSLASGESVTGTLLANCGTKWLGNQEAFSGDFFIVKNGFSSFSQETISGKLRSSGGDCGGGSETFIVHGTQDPIISNTTAHCLGRNGGQENIVFDIAHRSDVVRLQECDTTPTLTARMGTGGNNVPCVALAGNTIGQKPENGGNGNGFDESGVSYTLTSTDVHAVTTATVIRKLTPIECERLQGFPDNWTKIPYRNKPAEDCPDSPRYKAIGNSMAVPVMRWIGEKMINYLNKPSES
ncbi:DNA (cytosine-5-)-methyltransferase [Rodentibacter caecimuris]|uniref:DNA cytosine methyltransferase n=1 Tax=Rodentibacter caecimuris TaxID=1796644 RepID=UPI00075167F2|nr:DNA cytosine methyltransferase [Rodentibacter heylii]AOF53659.1 Cytosine-specific DNA methyltransferase [Pasteurellaceae bacterium NI1060]OOF73338.1 DNA (cytosine-5-)-methyltransferase [Rodentibacter heylii]